ncbi:hypothetical protein CSAL01_12444 [Colletotrichum salicis]|uniref:Uncharacterized protein n=1 Tax=Colletotrichum salicis TaxID=1209931 RepID=A0A135U487_9PEZI|nr:hypothetical protein CSAL01_12444 [Colletotrichum salicis]
MGHPGDFVAVRPHSQLRSVHNLLPINRLTQPPQPKFAITALTPDRKADRLPKPDEQPVDLTPFVLGKPALQRVPRRLGLRRLVPAPEVRDAVYVHVHADAFGAVPGCGQAEVGHFGSDTRQGGEAFDCVGDVAVEFVAEDDGCRFDESDHIQR